MTELGGYLQEQDLIEECAKASQSMNEWTEGILSESDKQMHQHYARAVIGVLRRRQCLSDIGLEQIKLSEERMK